ncbi:cilia- and flagella-associated protein 337-like isoform X2 [Ptychodera flava]|uniref:cilia- and flagella-associated protein 337-like isoform X2 n=1 Tax=Ptychodera flava TaxID=63121 RepID=UPI00396A4D5B
MPPVKKPGRIIRPTSATAKLESYIPPSVLDDVRPATAAAGLFAGEGGPSSRGPAPPSRQGAQSAWGTRFRDDIPKPDEQPRRLTLSLVDGLADRPETAAARARLTTPAASSGTKIEEKINLEHLHSLKKSFEVADKSGTGTLTLEEFKEVIKNSLGLRRNDDQITALFMKIDSLSEGKIAWDEFCTYMQLEYAEKEDAYLRQKEVSFHTPAMIESTPHRETILRIDNMSDGIFVAVSQDGTISFWNSQLDLKRTKTLMSDQNINRQKPKWITDMVLMQQYNKIILGTGDREIQFYESSTFEPYCQVSGLETVPLKLAYCPTGYDECLIMYGDVDGCVNIIVIYATGETLRTWKKMPKTDGIASVTLEKVAHNVNGLTKFIRWKVHEDWVLELRYYEELRSIISCSNHENTALVIGSTTGSTHVESQLREIKESLNNFSNDKKGPKLSQQNYIQTKRRMDSDQTVFKVYKGVKTFDFSKDKNIIVTGGMDRIVRIWNPYVPSKPTGMLRGHNAPIFYLSIAADENRIYSISTDKTVRVWDIKDQTCMLTLRPKSHKIRGDIQACHYNRVTRSLAIATDQMALLNQKVKPQQYADIVITHKEPVHCCRYNASFKQVVTCSDGSAVKLWEFETGKPVFEFSQAHGDNAITAMAFDNTGRRLITGGRDGKLKVWNYNNGHCLKTLEKEDNTEEITSINYIEMNRNRYIISVGWDRRINIFTDSSDDFHHVQKPLPKWQDDVNHGHKEDILSLASAPPNLLASSSYDGEIIVWNLVSGHIYCHLISPKPQDYQSVALDGDNSICKLIFLEDRAANKHCAQLVASGPRGCIHFWNVYNGGELLAQFSVGSNRAAVSNMVASEDSTMLFTGDAIGFVHCWKIDGYCLRGKESEPPELIISWRAHVQSVTSMDLVEEHGLILTSSLDCTVRLWTIEGEYVGTFGQQEPWDVYNKATFLHPMVPYDVLVDPQSLPHHPCLDGKLTAAQVIHAESLENGENDSEEEEEEEEERKNDAVNITNYLGVRTQFVYDDNMIQEELKGKPYDDGTGKRLRHEKHKPRPKDRGGPNAYQNLKCFDLDDTPPPSAPTKHRDKTDPFDFEI